MNFKQLLRKLPRSKLVRRSTLVGLALFPIALAFTVGADGWNTAETSKSAGPTSPASISAAAAAQPETALLFSDVTASIEDPTYVPELLAYSDGAPSIDPVGDGDTATFAFDNASNTVEGTVDLEENLSLSEYIQAKVQPAAMPYGAPYGRYGSTTGKVNSHASTFPTTGGIPEPDAGAGVKAGAGINTHDPVDSPGSTDIPSNTGLYNPSQPTSVPEPETWALWVIGLLGCFLSRRRTTRTN